jgi:hypothetical protein
MERMIILYTGGYIFSERKERHKSDERQQLKGKTE